MSYTLDESPSFPAVVNADVPIGKGRTKKVSFEVIFARLSTDGYDDLVKRINESRLQLQVDPEAAPAITDQEVIDQVLVGFGDDLIDKETKLPMEFTPANVARLVSVYPMRPALVKAFFDNFVNAGEKK